MAHEAEGAGVEVGLEVAADLARLLERYTGPGRSVSVAVLVDTDLERSLVIEYARFELVAELVAGLDVRLTWRGQCCKITGPALRDVCARLAGRNDPRTFSA